MSGAWAPEWVPWLILGVVIVVVPPVAWLIVRWRFRKHDDPRPLPLDPDSEWLIGSSRWGAPVRRVATEVTAADGLACLAGRHKILAGQHYWEIPLHGQGEGRVFYNCLACAPGDPGVTREP